LNELAGTAKPPSENDPRPGAVPSGESKFLSEAESLIRESFPSLDLPFRQPDLELLGVIAGIKYSDKTARLKRE